MGQRKSGHVTLLDIARSCGYSVSTVSIVLSEAPLSQNVAASTKERIRKMAADMGYHPDAFARSLQRRRSQTIAVLAYDLSDPFCLPIVRGIQSGLQPANYLPLLIDAQTQRPLFNNYLRMVLERRAEGVIVIASWIFEETDLLADIEKNHVPIVIIGRDLTQKRVSSVLVDNKAGGALALEHLCRLGHRRVAVIRGPEEMFDSEPRWEGVQSAATKLGVALDPKLVFQLPSLMNPTSGFEGGVRLGHRLVEEKLDFSAVLAFDDLTALGVVRGLSEMGRRVPQDCSVIGFDDVLPAIVTTPGLTTIRQPLHEMGLLASKWVLDSIESFEKRTRKSAQLHQASPELVIRTSTARLTKMARRKSADST